LKLRRRVKARGASHSHGWSSVFSKIGSVKQSKGITASYASRNKSFGTIMPNEDSEPSQSVPIDILLVDDHSHVRKILREVLETYDNLKVVGEAINGEEAVLLAVALKPAAVVMDVHLPLVSGIAATTLIKTTNPFTAIIGLTAGDPHEDEKAMSIAGATTVIDKGQLLQALYPAILDAVKRIKHPV
jgi:CheY-like chemotaxis protein